MTVISVISGKHPSRGVYSKSPRSGCCTPKKREGVRRSAPRIFATFRCVLRSATTPANAGSLALTRPGRCRDGLPRSRSPDGFVFVTLNTTMDPSAVLKNAIDGPIPSGTAKAAGFVSFMAPHGARQRPAAPLNADPSFARPRFAHLSTSPSPPVGLTTRAARSTLDWRSSRLPPGRSSTICCGDRGLEQRAPARPDDTRATTPLIPTLFPQGPHVPCPS